MKKFLAAIIFYFVATLSCANADESSEVKTFVDNIGNKVVSIANEKNVSESSKRQRIIGEIDKVIDSDWIARFVLGKNYKVASDQEKQHFSELYRQFMINTYGPKFKNYNGRKFNVKSVEQQSGFYVARCEFLPRDSNVPIDVDFRVKNRDGKLSVLDFVTEGISLIETQRSEFNSAISQKGMNGFIVDLERRVEILKKSK